MRVLEKLKANFLSHSNEESKRNANEMEHEAASGETTFSNQLQTSSLDKLQGVDKNDSMIDFNRIHSVMDKESFILVTNLNGEMIYIDEKSSVYLGYQPHELEGKHISILNSEMHLIEFNPDMKEDLLAGEVWKGEVAAKRKDGLDCWWFMMISPMLDNNGHPYQFVIIIIDITERKMKEKHVHGLTEQKELQQNLKNMMYYDVLTGLPNYISFEEHLNREIEYAQENNTNLAVIQLGIDDFKYFNSTFGRQIGNLFLKNFSNRMKNALSENITMYRMSGDMFILLIKGHFDVDEVPETLCSLSSLASKEPFIIDKKDVFISVSMGVSFFPFSGETIESLLKNAEIAMFRAKSSGKNQYQIFSSTMNLYSYKQYTLRNDSKKALLSNEFRIFYQPRMNPMTNKMVSAEALIRWDHPEWGIVLPDEFISMAEDSGLIIPIGEWIIRKVCSELKKWEKKKLSLNKISINISPLQLLQPNFMEMVSSTLMEYRISPKWLEFEITENVMIEQEEKVLNTLIHLKKMGITIALDDFGTGYSSLSYLRRIPCETIKIDKSLVKDIENEQENREIIESIITLSHKLNKSVVAEGVETQEQLLLLRSLGCDEIQGYWYCKPVDRNQFEKYLKDGIGVKIDQSTINLTVNQRKFYRISLEIPLCADMTIEKIGGKKIHLGSTEVLVHNIGPGGLNFSSPLKLPTGNEMILLFNTEILTQELKLRGDIVWNKEKEENYNTFYQYGVEFMINSGNEHEQLAVLLNTFQVKLRHSSILPGCRFYSIG